MIDEGQLEQIAIHCFQDNGWSNAHGPDIAPNGVTSERSDFRVVILTDRLESEICRLMPKLISGERAVPVAQTLATGSLT